MLRNALPGVPIVFDTVDLHFLRQQREAEATGLPSAAAAARLTRELELAIVRSVDTTLVVSPVERALLADLVPGADVRVLSNVHPRVTDPIPGPEGRSGACFVGSFAHAPNQDAIEWFIVQVLPLLRREAPDLPIRIIGADPPPDLVAAAPAGVEYLGWVENLAGTYATARIALAPLRYGAGVKGKVGEAMAHGVPVVTTSVGAEGMGLDDAVTALIADDPAPFASAIVALVRDDHLWRRLSAAGREHVDALFGEVGFAAAVRDVLGPDPATGPDAEESA
jgi:hypothetical protein